MKIAFSIILLISILSAATSVFADISSVADDSFLVPDSPSPMNGDSLALIITVLCLSAIALVALLITSIIMKRKK